MFLFFSMALIVLSYPSTIPDDIAASYCIFIDLTNRFISGLHLGSAELRR